jgi:hypothetical protein
MRTSATIPRITASWSGNTNLITEYGVLAPSTPKWCGPSKCGVLGYVESRLMPRSAIVTSALSAVGLRGPVAEKPR